MAANCFQGEEAPDRPLAEDIDDVSLRIWTLRNALGVFSCSPSSSNRASFGLGFGTAPFVVFHFVVGAFSAAALEDLGESGGDFGCTNLFVIGSNVGI